MEGAGKLVDDEELAEAMKERGLGTPATRADTIDGLINQKYIERAAARTRPDSEGRAVAAVSRRRESGGADQARHDRRVGIQAPPDGARQIPRDKFMAEIVEVTKGIVDRIKNFEEDDTELARNRHHLADRRQAAASRRCAATSRRTASS